ncbi:MAG TPA: plastocyanin/azurin family copper-binding protein [Rariglobus sp.]|jgi:azurin|nr:plastocyanin/azurin family copper-binding protein [Rariglobus sp.]
MKPIHLISLTTVVTVLAFTGCGRSEKDISAASTSAVAAVVSTPKAVPSEGRAIEITASDAMKFDLAEIRAKPGEALAVTLKNLGTMPKFSMGHNWVLLDAGVDLNAFAGDTGLAAKTEYIPTAYKDQIIAATKLLGPKESDTVRFYAPAKPGRYPFICSFPGHFQVGMKGELIVE